LDAEDIGEENKTWVVDFYALITWKRPSLAKGLTMTAEDRALSRKRSECWLAFIKALWNCSGLFDVKSPKTIPLTDYLYETLVGKFAKYIFVKIFKSVESIVHEGVQYPIIDLQRNHLLLLLLFKHINFDKN
jgi:hypothetical protein